MDLLESIWDFCWAKRASTSLVTYLFMTRWLYQYIKGRSGCQRCQRFSSVPKESQGTCRRSAATMGTYFFCALKFVFLPGATKQ